MKILVLDEATVRELLTMPECIAVMRDALVSLANGRVHQPLRTIVRPPGAAGMMGLMPVHSAGDASYARPEPVIPHRGLAPGAPVYALKTVCVFHDNPAIGMDAHQGGVTLFSGETGELLALMNATAITAIRTAAASGVATDLLARADAGILAIVGAGVQARTHLAAMAAVRPIREARIASRTFEHARAMADEVRPRYPFAISAVRTAAEAVTGADIIVTATTSFEPVIARRSISPGAHINAIGTYLATAREIDTATVADSRLFVDHRESAMKQAGEYALAAAEGAIGPDHIRGEIGELLTGACAGRGSADEITLFKSLGLAVEDLAAAAFLYRKAQARNAGSWVAF